MWKHLLQKRQRERKREKTDERRYSLDRFRIKRVEDISIQRQTAALFSLSSAHHNVCFHLTFFLSQPQQQLLFSVFIQNHSQTGKSHNTQSVLTRVMVGITEKTSFTMQRQFTTERQLADTRKEKKPTFNHYKEQLKGDSYLPTHKIPHLWQKIKSRDARFTTPNKKDISMISIIKWTVGWYIY